MKFLEQKKLQFWYINEPLVGNRMNNSNLISNECFLSASLRLPSRGAVRKRKPSVLLPSRGVLLSEIVMKDAVLP